MADNKPTTDPNLAPPDLSPKLADDDRPIWERAAELAKTLPAETIAGLPTDGATQLDHYLYGSPKKPVVPDLSSAGDVGWAKDLTAANAEIDIALDCFIEAHGEMDPEFAKSPIGNLVKMFLATVQAHARTSIDYDKSQKELTSLRAQHAVEVEKRDAIERSWERERDGLRKELAEANRYANAGRYMETAMLAISEPEITGEVVNLDAYIRVYQRQKEELSSLTTALAARDAEIEGLVGVKAERDAAIRRCEEVEYREGMETIERDLADLTAQRDASQSEAAALRENARKVYLDAGHLLLESPEVAIAEQRKRGKELVRLREQVKVLEGALNFISVGKCERLTSGKCADQPTWTRDHKYLAYRWCNSCIAMESRSGQSKSLHVPPPSPGEVACCECGESFSRDAMDDSGIYCKPCGDPFLAALAPAAPPVAPPIAEPVVELPTPAEHPNGLHGRYRITKHDGTPCDPRAFYFVLRLDPYGDDQGHIHACRRAATLYCDAAPPHLKKVADELRTRVEAFKEARWSAPQPAEPGKPEGKERGV